MQISTGENNRSRNTKAAGNKTKNSSDSSAASESGNNFQTLLEQIGFEETQPEKPLHINFEQVVAAEDDLIANPNQYNLSKYRSAIQEILRRIQSESVRVVEVKMGRDRKLGHVVQVINEKLDYVAKGLTSDVKTEDGKVETVVNPAFNILQNLSDIRGLLLDLMR